MKLDEDLFSDHYKLIGMVQFLYANKTIINNKE